MAEFFRSEIKTQIAPLPVDVIGAVAVRAALRTLPMLALRKNDDNSPFQFWEVHNRRRYLFSVLSCCKAAVFINCVTDTDVASLVATGTASVATIEADEARAFHADKTSPTAHAIYAARAAVETAIRAAKATHAISIGAPNTARSARAMTIDAALTSALAAYRSYNLAEESILKDLIFTNARDLLQKPLWLEGEPEVIAELKQQFKDDVFSLNEDFEIWMDWYQDRVDGKPLDLELERKGILLPDEVAGQSVVEINAYLKGLREDAFTGHLNHARALFIGHGGVGKTSLINVLHGEAIAKEMTPGVALGESHMHMEEGAAVVTRLKDVDDAEMTVHFWDFGGQVMAQATHTFFFKSQCLYVIVMNAREERNANEEAEYWLEHVRAFGGDAPVLLVGNKSDLVTLNLDMASLHEKYKNVMGFHAISCEEADGNFKGQFETFKQAFYEVLKELSQDGIGFTSERFEVLNRVRDLAKSGDFLKHADFEEICAHQQIPMEGAGNRDALLDLLDKLGIVIHFPHLPYLTDFVLNPRWLTYGVYTIMYSDCARKAEGRICDQDIGAILAEAVYRDDEKELNYPRDKCRVIADAMVAFKVAYRPSQDMQKLVIPALLSTHQPKHDFTVDDALVFQVDFKGFLPRHLLPTLISDFYQNIALYGGREVVWQNGVLLRPEVGTQAEAMIRADYHERNLYVQVKGRDAQFYLSHIHQRILETLETMPDLPFEEKVQLRPHMRVVQKEMARIGDEAQWMSYNILRTAQEQPDMGAIPGPDGFIYSVKKVLSAAPVPPDLRPSDVMLSYSRKNHELLSELYHYLLNTDVTVWYDEGIIGGQAFAEVIQHRIDSAKAVVVLWSDEALGSEWVMREAQRGLKQDKLISICLPGFDEKLVPEEFREYLIVPFENKEGILEAINLKKREKIARTQGRGLRP